MEQANSMLLTGTLICGGMRGVFLMLLALGTPEVFW